MFLRRFRSDALDQLPRFARRGERDGGIEVLPTIALVGQVLDEFGLKHSIDDDGDLLVRWESCTIYFFFYGEKNEVLQARLYLNRRFSVDDRGSLSLLLDEWNRTRLFAKAYTILPDDGMVGICAEQSRDFEGSTRAQLKYAVASWIDTLLRFGDWVDDQI
ncbi:MAG: YbjN domain-containing protein [Jatrophihabitans sp.]